MPAFAGDTNYFNANSVYTWSDDYFANNSNLPVNLMILAGNSEPLEMYGATNFVNYLDSVHSFATSFLVDPTMTHPIDNFLTSFGDTMYSFQNQHICNAVPNAISNSENTLNNLVIYPNPSERNFYVDSKTPFSWKVLDLTGKLISYGDTNKNIDLLGSAKGMYLLNIKSGDSETQHKIIVK